MKNDRVYILRESVVKITQMLSGKGIKVTQQGVNAYVKADHNGTPVVVNLPYLPDNAGEDLCMAIQGFLDHEVAHILFTEFPVMGKAMKQGRQIGFLLNALEDPRIEKCMAQRFQGSAYNLAVTGRFYLDKFVKPKMEEAAKAGNANEVINTLMVPMIRAMSGQQVFQEFMKDKWTIVAPVYERIKDLAPKIEAAASTTECFELAKEIGKRMQDGSDSKGEGEGEGGSGKSKSAAKPSAGKSKSKPTGEDEKGEGGAAGKSESKDSEDDKSSASGAKSKPKKEEKEDEGEGAGEGEKDKGEDKAEDEKGSAPEKGDDEDEETKPEAEPAPSEDEPEDDDSDVKAEAEEPEEEPAEEPEAEAEAEAEAGEDDGEGEVSLDSAQPIWEALDKDGANGFDESMSRVITAETSDAARSSEYVIFTKEYDVVEKLKVGSGYDPKMTQRLIEKVEHMVAPLQKDLERAVAARSLAIRTHGHRSGKLQASNLSRLRFGDDRVFSRKSESESKDVAVELVVDASGSMSGSKIHTACQSAYALSAVLDRLSIKNEVICFTTKEMGSRDEMYEQQSKLGVKFARMEGIYMPILKGYDERMTAQIKERFGWLPNTRILRSNVDGESIEIAARRLLARREHSKVMIVLSDGYPAASGAANFNLHLKKTVKEIEKAGVRLVGIGIESEAVKDFYPRNLVLHSVEELPGAVMKQLRSLLMP